MTRCNRGVLIIGLLLVLAPTLVFAGGFNLAGAGMKGLAMSGAFRAIADDWSAMYWNPAGLAGQGTGIYLEAKVLFPNTRIIPNTPSTVPDYDGYYLYRNGVEQSSINGGRPTGSFAFQWQFSDKLTAGLAAFTPNALGADWENLYLGPYPGYGDNPEYPDQAWMSSMYVIDIHPTVGYMLTEKLSVGAGLSIKVASIELQSPALVPGRNPETGDRLPLPGSHYFIDATLKGSEIGVGFNLGVLYHVNDKLSTALTFVGPSLIPIDGTLSQTLYLPALAGGGTVEVEPDAKADFPIPMEVGAGVAYKFTPEFTAAFDVKWTQWSSLDVIDIELDGTGPDGQPANDTELILNWEDTVRFNVGFMWDVSEAVQLRAGYYFDPTPIPGETMRPTITDVADKHSWSFGLGYDFGNGFTVDGTYQHLWGNDNDAEAADNDGDGLYDNVPGTWNMQVITIGVQLGYRF
ncbi:outer membrane protein transport protein [bacterium]|nr:outer membrane protein transport protein [bacterium]